jgi:cytochrome c oxidase assembly factor CtaG
VIMRGLGGRLRPWLAVVAAVLAVGALVPPGGTEARQYVFAQAVQFAVLAVVAPALIVLGAPWSLSRAGARFANLTSARLSSPAASTAILVGFIGVALAWRLPVAVNALVKYPALTVVEAVTLIAVGCALWLKLVDSPPRRPGISRPLRALFAAAPMWAIWASAYVMGFSRATWFTALAHRGGLSTVADQQIAAALEFAIAGLSFVPVVYVSLITWLRDSADPGDEPRAPAEGADQPGRAPVVPAGPVVPRPPRGWRQAFDRR